ncbi:MAG: hypothetical protein JXA90_00745, partial [Planctomycetes bacterium]|nr:hypothetical protein [Planctomycetota bacterium]
RGPAGGRPSHDLSQHPPHRRQRGLPSARRGRGPAREPVGEEDLDESAGRVLIHRRSYPMTWSGVAIGLLLSVVLWFGANREAADVVREDEQRKENLSVHALRDRKEGFRNRVKEEAQQVQKTFESAQRVAANRFLSEEGRRDQIASFIAGICDKPGALAVVQQLAKLEVMQAPASTMDPSSHHAQEEYAKYMDMVTSLERENRLSDAIEVLREIERSPALYDSRRNQVDQKFKDISDEITRRWDADEQEYVNASAAGNYDAALRVLDKAQVYAAKDEAIRKSIEQFRRATENQRSSSAMNLEDDSAQEGEDESGAEDSGDDFNLDFDDEETGSEGSEQKSEGDDTDLDLDLDFEM